MRWGAEDFSEWEAKRRRRWRQKRLFKKIGLVVAFLAAFGAAWEYLPESMDLSYIYKQWAQERQVRKSWVYYPNCDAARADGAAPIRIGEPGYRPALDADHDGIACEPIPAWAR
jgi:hypothetical protein